MDAHIPADAPADLFITAALDARPSGLPDYSGDSRAIQAFAVAVANEPETILSQYVDLALKLTGGSSAGFSLWEPDPAPGVFRWHFLTGALGAFNGATTPRNYSPCGITLDRNEPVLTLHPERVYSWLVEAGVMLPEVLLVPLRRGDGEPFGTLWVVSEVEGQLNRGHAALLAEIADCAGLTAARYSGRAEPVR